MLIDLANMSMTRTISSRENDQNGFKVIVPLKERGKPVDLTGYVVKYEAISPYGNFVRDDAVVTNATGGVFEYTVSKEAVSSAGVWIGYFAFEKGTERFTTQDIRISLGCDVKQGNIAIEDYIAEFDKLKKQIDALQVAVDKVNVVKKSGDTMTGNLSFAESQGVQFRNTVNGIDANFYKNATHIIMRDVKGNSGIFDYDFASKKFNLSADTNLVKKSEAYTELVQPNGNTILVSSTNIDDLTKAGFYSGNNMVGSPLGSGIIYINVWSHSPSYTRQEVRSATDHTGVVYERKRVSGTWGAWVNVNGNDKDTTWTNLTLINGATVDAGNTPKYIRKGDVIYIVGAVTNITDSMTIVNLPTGLRPTSNCAFAVAYLSTDSKKYAGEINVRPDGRITLDWMWNNVKSVSFCISYHL